jgi:type I restriction enzyme S subunit
MPRLGTEAGREAPFVLSPLNEQKRISDKLDAILARVDACRERLDRIPAILKRFRQAVLAAATSGKLTEKWRKKNDASYWEKKLFGDVYQLIDGDRGPNYPKQKDYSQIGHCLFLSTKNVRPLGFLFDEKVFITKNKHEQLRNGMLQVGDVIITTRGTLGNVAIYDKEIAAIQPVVRINSGMLIVREKVVGSILSEYLKLYIASPVFFEQLLEKQTGSAQPQIPAGILKTFSISIPVLAEQAEIVRRVEELFAYADRLEARYAAARAQVDKLTPAILAKAFRGELVPQDPDDEPASVLLERIREAQAKAKDKIKRSSSIAQPK